MTKTDKNAPFDDVLIIKCDSGWKENLQKLADLSDSEGNISSFVRVHFKKLFEKEKITTKKD